MSKVKFVLPVKFNKPTSLLKYAEKAGVKIDIPCNKGKCKKCKVIIDGMVSPLTAQELKALSKEEIEEGVRLACQVEILGKCKITLT